MDNFNTVYNKYISTVNYVAYKYSNSFKDSMYDKDYLVSIGAEVLWKISKKYDSKKGSFSNFLHNALNNKFGAILKTVKNKPKKVGDFSEFQNSESYNYKDSTLTLYKSMKEFIKDKDPMYRDILDIAMSSMYNEPKYGYTFRLKDIKKKCNIKNIAKASIKYHEFRDCMKRFQEIY